MEDPPRLVPLHLTRPMSTAMNETLPSRSVRIPFRVPAETHHWRIVLRNANYRASATNPGAVTVRTIAVGDAETQTTGMPTGAFGEGSESFPEGFLVHRYDTLVKDLGETEWASDWFTNVLLPHRDYLLSYGFRTNGQVTHRGIAGAWWTGGNPLNAELRSDPSATRTKRPPLDVRIELTVADSLSTQVVIGDSIAAGSSATFPIREAPAMLAAQAGSTPWPVLHTFGGATLSEWVGGWSTLSNLKWQDVVRYGSHDRAVIALGSNDIHAGKDLAALKRNFSRLVELVTDRISSRIVASTVTPRSSWAHTEPAKETVRQHFNDWLTQLPENIAACIDTAGAVTDASGRAPATDLIEPDGIHFNTAGSLRCADAYAHVGQTGL